MGKRVAIVGATGAVGAEMLLTLEKREYPVDELFLFASARSAGKKLAFKGKDHAVEELTKTCFDGKKIDIALFSAGASRSKEFAPAAVSAGALVIDNSSAFRMDEEIPLVVPEVNPEDAKRHKGIIANPNCSTIQMVVALKPLHDAAKILRVEVATYQAVSGAGQAAMDEFVEQTKDYLGAQPLRIEKFAHQIAFNLIPHIDVFLDNGYTKEEMKMVLETRKIMHAPDMRVSATCVRVPVLRAHSEAITISTEKKLSAAHARELLAKAPGIIVQDTPVKNEYPMPFFVSGAYPVYVGRIREDISQDNGLAFFCVADQLLKGAALNAVQIAELFL
jgi:aspartate-semialdehyde dehydrogenase